MIFKRFISASGRIHYLIRLLIFWLILFTMFRVILIISHTLGGFETIWFSAFYSLGSGIRLDVSTIAYLMIPSLLLWATYQWKQIPFLKSINKGYHLAAIFCITLLSIANAKMYNVWESLLNYTVFDYLLYPAEVLSFISLSELFFWIILGLVFFMISIRVYKKLVSDLAIPAGKKTMTTLSILLVLPMLAIAARGGLQLIPINESSAYFSETPFYNHVSINPSWYFVHSFLETEATSNPFIFMDASVAEKKNENLFLRSKDQRPLILSTPQPNIVFIVLESWTADIISALGGEENVTPQFDLLRKEGLLFSNIYSAGSRTEHGLVSILSGYPPPPHQSIITVPYKAEKLGSLSEILHQSGYHTSFYYGGEIGFANMKSYLVNEAFDHIADKNLFDEEQLNSKWGAHDEFVFEKQLEDLVNMPEPFFSVLLTLSTHEPFEVPMQTPFNGNTEPDQFRKSAYYADHCLGEYFKKIKMQPWYDRTLFVLVADHGHKLPKKRHLNLPVTKKVPLLFMGGALHDAYKNEIIDIVANQHDLVATLLSQLDKPYDVFERSRDLLDPATRSYAYYTNDNVLGWITPEQQFVYSYATKSPRVIRSDLKNVPLNDSIFLDAKAYLQTHYQAYLDF